MAVILDVAAYTWSFAHSAVDGGSDVFPRQFETAALFAQQDVLLNRLKTLDLLSYRWSEAKMFLVPKSKDNFRWAHLMDPMDSLILAALMKTVGNTIEKSRIPADQDVVFSHRFSPNDFGQFYIAESWVDFWRAAVHRSELDSSFVLSLDVRDCYNQLEQRTVLSQLKFAGLSEDYILLFDNMMNMTGASGILVGPHSTHLLAELALNKIDQTLLKMGLRFCRYVDDFHIFCSSKFEAESALQKVIQVLHEHNLAIQELKTKKRTSNEFQIDAERYLDATEDSMIGTELVEVIRAHTHDNDYELAALTSLSEHERAEFNSDSVGLVLDSSIESDPSLKNLGWLLRRFAQIGVPEAIDYVVTNFEDLLPIIADTTKYLSKATPNLSEKSQDFIQKILAVLELPIVCSNEYLQTVLIGIFDQFPSELYAKDLYKRYDPANPFVCRAVLLAVATEPTMSGWLDSRKSDFDFADSWLRRAIIVSLATCSNDAFQSWINQPQLSLTFIEKVTRAWALGVPLEESATIPSIASSILAPRLDQSFSTTKILNEVNVATSKILLVTVNESERNAVDTIFLAATRTEAKTFLVEDRYYKRIGVIAGNTIYHAHSEMGSGTLGGMQQTVEKGIRALRPNVVIAVGVAFGVNPKKQKIGDVLVSTQIWNYESQRIGTAKDLDGELVAIIVPRGTKISAPIQPINFLKTATHRFNQKQTSVIYGLLLSGEKLIDNLDYRDSLIALESEAVGGEMEGCGLCVAAQDKKVDWVIVKAICDWADGYKKRSKRARQIKAAVNSANLLLSALSETNMY